MWVVFSTGRFGQELASFETECEAHDYIMRKKEVTFNTGFKKKFVEDECCKTCKYQSSTPTCTNPKNEVVSPDQSSFILAPDNFGCINWEAK